MSQQHHIPTNIERTWGIISLNCVESILLKAYLILSRMEQGETFYSPSVDAGIYIPAPGAQSCFHRVVGNPNG